MMGVMKIQRNEEDANEYDEYYGGCRSLFDANGVW